MTPAEEVRARIAAIDQKIRDAEARLPAHSVKPPIMQELFALEEARETLVRRLRELAAP